MHFVPNDRLLIDVHPMAVEQTGDDGFQLQRPCIHMAKFWHMTTCSYGCFLFRSDNSTLDDLGNVVAKPRAVGRAIIQWMKGRARSEICARMC